MAQRSIDPMGVQGQLRRLLRRQRADPGGPWLHAEVARRMAERLRLIRLKPLRLVEWWGGLGASDGVLRQACPDALRTVVEPDPAWAEHARTIRQPAWWSARRWTGPADAVQTDAEPLPDGVHQLVFANMVMHAAADPPALFERWQRTLAVDGFVMFSCLGPGSFGALRGLYARLGWPSPGIDFVDMHDFGDMLVDAGFADPVMDQETLSLSWGSPAALLAELRSIGGNVHPGRPVGLRGRVWRRTLESELQGLARPDGRIGLDVEIAYGHAFKAAPRRASTGTSAVSLDEMRTLVRAARRAEPGPTGVR